MTRLFVILAALVVSACGSLPDIGPPRGLDEPRRERAEPTPPPEPAPEPEPSEHVRFARTLAAELERQADSDSPRLVAAEPEMHALADALAGRSPAPASPPRADAGALAPPPDMSGARSLLHAVHLASYRDVETLARGWRELLAEHPSLRGLDARYEAVDIPGRGRFLRLKAGPFDSLTDARRACAPLGERWCDPVDFTGAPVPAR